MKDKDNTVTYRCETHRCPFMIVFSLSATGHTLNRYDLFHSHAIGDAKAFEFRSLIKEVEEHTEFVYDKYFFGRINHEKGSIVFLRPCLILDNLLLLNRLDLNALTSNI